MSFDLNGNHVFQASQQEVWEAMIDPDVLEACLPAVAYIDQHAVDHFEVMFEKRFGFIPIRGSMNIHILDIAGNHTWRIEASGTHKLIGGAKAGADIKTFDLGDGTTRLEYAAFASFGEALLKIMGSAYEARINGWIEGFFEKFQKQIDENRFSI